MYEHFWIDFRFLCEIALELDYLSPYACFQLLAHCSVLLLQLSFVPGIVARDRFKLEPEMMFLFNSFFLFIALFSLLLIASVMERYFRKAYCILRENIRRHYGSP